MVSVAPWARAMSAASRTAATACSDRSAPTRMLVNMVLSERADACRACVPPAAGGTGPPAHRGLLLRSILHDVSSQMYTAPMRLGELYRLGRRLQDLADRAMGGGRSFDFSVSEVIVISDLLDHADSTIGDLSSRTGFAQSRVSTVVAALRDRGWIETAVDEADRRCTR